jgi:hypothetical protein|nr:MAG TPA: hypothetical protein [Caudoviricetes sp.]
MKWTKYLFSKKPYGAIFIFFLLDFIFNIISFILSFIGFSYVYLLIYILDIFNFVKLTTLGREIKE